MKPLQIQYRSRKMFYSIYVHFVNNLTIDYYQYVFKVIFEMQKSL